MNKSKVRNLLAFGTLIVLSATASALIGYMLCLFMYKAPNNHFSFSVPNWLYWATGTIVPIFSFAQTLLLFKIYLYVQDLKSNRLKEVLLPFTITFVPSWVLLSPYAMLWALLCKWDRIIPNTAIATYFSILKASLEGLTLLSPMLIVTVCIALYSTFVWQALKNVFGDYLPNTNNMDSATPQ